MEERKRTGFTIIIAFVLMAALLYSFGLNLFSPRPQLELADPDRMDQSNVDSALPSEGSGGLLLEVTPTTVQKVIATISRYESYSRTMTITYTWENEVSSITAQIWEDNGWKHTQVSLPNENVECSITGNESFWLWYEDSLGNTLGQIIKGSIQNISSDLMQRLPTYEDILLLDPEEITDAGYVEYNGQPCIYVEAVQEELGYIYRYWVSETSGLLMATETEKLGVIVYRMSSNEVISPFPGNKDAFILPDGTVPS